jgi:hypothetical protein
MLSDTCTAMRSVQCGERSISTIVKETLRSQQTLPQGNMKIPNIQDKSYLGKE